MHLLFEIYFMQFSVRKIHNFYKGQSVILHLLMFRIVQGHKISEI